MSKKKETTKKVPLGIVCVLHGTFSGMPKCPICEGFVANGALPACGGGCGAKILPARRFAFTPVVHNDRAFSGGSAILIGRADEGTRGYTVVAAAGTFADMDSARKKADDLNERTGLDTRQAALIVAGTMHFRESELVGCLKRALTIMEQVRNGAADDAELEDWADDARRLAQV